MTSALEALSPVDGRYAQAAAPLRAILSEAGLIRQRIRIEARWLLFLHEHRVQLPALVALSGAGLPLPVLDAARVLATEPPADATEAVKAIESRINHDVKAVEYFVRGRLAEAGASAAQLELVHIGCTSEDINSLAYACLLAAARQTLLGVVDELFETLRSLANKYASVAMLARTHGQPASPTTLGKEFANVASRIGRARARFAAVTILGKWNGAVGNFNAHWAIDPAVDWPSLAQRFVESLGLAVNPHTTQIEPHDWIAEYCDAVAAINVVLTDLARDCWGYISLGYLRQRAVAGEVGSSTMPHKVNPIDFENAEGNLGIANALLRHFAEKLPVSRFQRDLTDSTVLRNLGVALAHALIGWRSLARGLAKIEPDPARLAADLVTAWEVLGEAIQTVLRAAGVPSGYERLKEFSRGQAIDRQALHAFIATLPLGAAEKDRLLRLTPADYVGFATELASKV